MNPTRRTFALALLIAFVSQIARADDASRISYDKQCITLDGKDYFLYSGAFHYFRCPKELWRDRFRKLKEAGFNTVETYVAWNWHEQTPPANVDDYSKCDMTDLRDFLAMATDEFGLNVYIRPGPYICAEWDGGGYPQWFVTQRPKDFSGKQFTRGDDPTYLAWCKHWFTAVAKVAAPFQVTHRPAGKAGIILWQIENEYNYANLPANVKLKQLQYLAHASRDLGIDVPLTTCMTNDAAFRKDDYLVKNVIETRNTYPKYSVQNEAKDLLVLDTYQPEKFRMVTELQGGWFSQVGGLLSEQQGFDETHINHVTLFAWEHGFTATNYYMGFGGTNFGDWAASDITTSYDYDCPVREPGGVTARYFAVKALGNFLNDHAAQLVRATDEKVEIKSKTDEDVTVTVRKATDGSRFIFVRTEQRDSVRKGDVTIETTGEPKTELTAKYELGPFGSKVLFLPSGATSDTDGQWYPKPVEGPKRPDLSELPAPVKITEARMKADPGPSAWKPLATGESEEAAGVYHRGFVYYRATVPPLPQGQKVTLLSRVPGRDWAGFWVNGKRIGIDAKDGGQMLDTSMSGEPLLGLYENYGRPNGGEQIDRSCGITDLRIIPILDAPRAITGWRIKHDLAGKKHPDELSPKTDDSTWAAVDITGADGDLKPNETAAYRTWIELSDAELATPKTLVLERVDDIGTVAVNGKTIGECRDWSVAQRFDLGKNLHAGKNLIAVIVANSDGPGGLAAGASLESNGPSIPAMWELSDQTAGVTEKWWANDLDDSSWQTAKLDGNATPSASAAPLSWYRMKFELPEPKANIWAPLKLRLDAAGNGFLYLNGHALGRWWQVGPQRDFYLPECWLYTGAGKTNVLTISLRPTDGVGVKSATIVPYENQAEMR